MTGLEPAIEVALSGVKVRCPKPLGDIVKDMHFQRACKDTLGMALGGGFEPLIYPRERRVS